MFILLKTISVNNKGISGRLSINQIKYLSNQIEGKQSYSHRDDNQEFRVLNLRKIRNQERVKRKAIQHEVLTPRSKQMAVDQDWGAVWPGPRSFHPATVPLPVRQGFTPIGQPPPDKYANAELMKIPNFLHLTPPVIKRQCTALTKFCTKWPEGLETEDKWKKHFPIDVITSDYCHGLPTIRNPLARIVTIQMKLSALPLDKHARDKFQRLVGERHDEKTDILTIVTDRCPVRKQNLDYSLYLLTALFHESWMTEPWENMKQEADMEYYDWSRNKSKLVTSEILNWTSKDTTDREKEPMKEASQEFRQSVETLINEGESQSAIDKYKEEVIKLLNLTSLSK